MTTAIGERYLNLFIGAAVELYHPADATTTTVYWSNRSWVTNANDSVAPNRQYVGLLLQAFELDYSWFNGDTLGGRSTRNYGVLRAINADGAHSLRYLFESVLGEAPTVQGRTITYHIGEIGEDLGSMITFTLAGRSMRLSEDGFEVVIELADDGQTLDTSILIDRFQGLGFAIRHDPAEASTVGASAALDPTTAWYFDVAYRLRPGMTLGSGLQIASRAASGGGHVYRLELYSTGKVRILSRTSADATVTLDATDLSWTADGRWHRIAGKWTGTVLEAYHSTRTGGAKSTVTTAQTTIKTGTGATSFGDVGSTLATHEWVDIGEIRLALDGNVPTETQILERMKRPLTSTETASYRYYIKCNENTGTTSADETGNGHTLTLHASASWENSHEGDDDLAGQAKPLSFGYVFNAPITWTRRQDGYGSFHARGYKGIEAIYEGANRLVLGWPKTYFQGVRFTSAGNVISFDAITSPTGIARFNAQPGMQGLVAGQQIAVVGTASNNATFTLASDSTERTITVTSGVTDESPVDCFITVAGTPDVQVYFDAGAVKFTNVPTLPVTAEVLGDYGNATPTDSSPTWWPQYTAAIMRTILRDWGGVPTADISDNWDNGVVEPNDAVGAYWAQAGVWIDPGSNRTVRDVLDQGADTLWARWGQVLAGDTWNLHVIVDPATEGTDIALDPLSTLGLRRIRSVPPIGGLTMRAMVNYAPLQEGDVAGIAAADTAAALRREHIEKTATPDTAVAAAYPSAEIPAPISTWLRNASDAATEAQRRYDILKVEREMYDADAILYGFNQDGLDQGPLKTILTIMDEDFPTTEDGKDFWLVHLRAVDEATTLTGWG